MTIFAIFWLILAKIWLPWQNQWRGKARGDKTPCKNCERVYVGETGRPLGARVKEHCKEVDSITGIFTSRKDQGSQYLQQICNHRSCLQWESCDRLGKRQGDWLRIRQSWQTHKGGDMDQEDWQHESRRGELPVEPHMEQAFTYWRPAPEVSPDEGFRQTWSRNVDKQYVIFGCIRVINIVIYDFLLVINTNLLWIVV